MPDKALTPSPSPSGRGELENSNITSEAKYRAMATKVMVDVARNLRQRQTSAEDALWQHLRGRKLNNLKFRRQHPIANTAFVADFFCYEAHLVIEIDGGIHTTQRQEDELRQATIEELGYTVLRFTNEQVKNNLEFVLSTIAIEADKLRGQSHE